MEEWYLTRLITSGYGFDSRPRNKMNPPFSIKEAIRFGWDKTRAHSALVFQVVLTLFALEVANAVVSKTIGGTALGIMATIVIVVAEFLVGVGLIVIVLKLARGVHARYAEIIPPWSLAWRYFLASFLAGLAVLGGLILLVIPGVYMMLRLSMVRFVVVDGAGVRKSLDISSRLTEGVKWKLLWFFIVLILLNILGMLCLLVGLLVTLPVSVLAYAHVYTKLSR